MNPVSAMEHATKLVPAAYVAQAQSADNARANRTRQLLQQVSQVFYLVSRVGILTGYSGNSADYPFISAGYSDISAG